MKYILYIYSIFTYIHNTLDLSEGGSTSFSWALFYKYFCGKRTCDSACSPELHINKNAFGFIIQFLGMGKYRIAQSVAHYITCAILFCRTLSPFPPGNYTVYIVLIMKLLYTGIQYTRSSFSGYFQKASVWYSVKRFSSCCLFHQTISYGILARIFQMFAISQNYSQDLGDLPCGQRWVRFLAFFSS